MVDSLEEVSGVEPVLAVPGENTVIGWESNLGGVPVLEGHCANASGIVRSVMRDLFRWRIQELPSFVGEMRSDLWDRIWLGHVMSDSIWVKLRTADSLLVKTGTTCASVRPGGAWDQWRMMQG